MAGWVYLDRWRGAVPTSEPGPVTLDDMLAPRTVAPGETLDLIWDGWRLSYEFVQWLANADVYRRHHGYAGVRIHFQGLLNRDFLDNVCRPALALFEGITEGHDRAVPTQYLTCSHKFLVEMFRRTGLLSQYKSPIKLPPRRPYATITLRETLFASRNSNLDAWLAFAQTAPHQHIIFVRDTAKADEPLDGFETCPAASRYLHHRMALYEAAEMNYFVPNGPSALALNTRHVPYIDIVKSPPDYQPHWGNDISPCMGVNRGEQYPWATSRQRMVWTADSFDEIMAAAATVAPERIAA